jgi:hypothetical protein
MQKINKMNIGKKNADLLKLNIEKNFREIINDYRKYYDINKIKKSFLTQRLFARFLSFRTLGPEILNPIIKNISKTKKRKIYLAPFIYIRHCEFGKFINNEHKNALLFTEPHHDKYTFNNNGNTFWIPIHNTDENTGTLCYIKKNKKICTLFPQNKKNRFNIKNYIKGHKSVEEIIRYNIRPVNCNYGSALYFDQNILHGAIHSNKSNRTSVNFQITFAKINQIKKNKNFYITNFFLKEKNILNLMYHGDFVYYFKNKKKIDYMFENKKLPAYLINIFNVLKQKTKSKNLNLLKDIHYSKEDNWLI